MALGVKYSMRDLACGVDNCSRASLYVHVINFSSIIIIVGGVAQWLGLRSLAGGLSLIYA